MAMASSSSSTTGLLYANYDWNNVTCNLSNCSTPNSFCFYDSCLSFPIPSPPPSLVYSNNKSNKFLPNFLIAAAALALLFLLLLSYSILRLHLRRRGAHPHQDSIDSLHHHDSGDFDDGDGGGIHHVWLIRTVGLDDSVIRAIPFITYSAGDGVIGDGKDCAVCLGEFTYGEVIKLLPKCNHAFHPNCINTWLQSHVNCPLCRAPIVLETTKLEAEHQNQEEYTIGIDSTSGSSSSPSNVLQPIRRSVSMDCLSTRRELLLEVPDNTKYNSGGIKEDILRKQRVEMKRSLSSKSGRLPFSKHRRGQGRSASVLPL